MTERVPPHLVVVKWSVSRSFRRGAVSHNQHSPEQHPGRVATIAFSAPTWRITMVVLAIYDNEYCASDDVALLAPEAPLSSASHSVVSFAPTTAEQPIHATGNKLDGSLAVSAGQGCCGVYQTCRRHNHHAGHAARCVSLFPHSSSSTFSVTAVASPRAAHGTAPAQHAPDGGLP